MRASSGARGEPARRPVSGAATPTIALTGAFGCSRAATSGSACRDGSPPWSHDYTSFMHTHAMMTGMLACQRGRTDRWEGGSAVDLTSTLGGQTTTILAW